MTKEQDDVTIYDIAREAGVSASTVSRVINDKPGVNRQTRERIRALLAEHRYVPNEAARGLVTQSSRLVGVLVADIRNQHHIEGAYYIAQELARLGYCALVLNTGGSDEERAAGIRMLETRKVEAAVLMGSIFQTEAVRDAIACSLPEAPVFMLNGEMDLPNVYSVLSDDRAGTADCVAYLAERGRKRVAFLVDQPTPSSRLKQLGYEDGAARAGMRALTIGGVEGSVEGGYAAAKALLAGHPDVGQRQARAAGCGGDRHGQLGLLRHLHAAADEPQHNGVRVRRGHRTQAGGLPGGAQHEQKDHAVHRHCGTRVGLKK